MYKCNTKWKKVKENNTHSKEQHKQLDFFVSMKCAHTYIYISIYHLNHTNTHSPSIHPPPPTYRGKSFFHLHVSALKENWVGGGGGSFWLERLSMNVTLDRYHTKANTEFEEEAERDNSLFPLSWSYIKYCTRKTVYERVLFYSHLIF